MKIQVLEREFVYHGSSLADPNPKLSIEEVRSFYANSGERGSSWPRPPVPKPCPR